MMHMLLFRNGFGCVCVLSFFKTERRPVWLNLQKLDGNENRIVPMVETPMRHGFPTMPHIRVILIESFLLKLAVGRSGACCEMISLQFVHHWVQERLWPN